MPSLMLSKQIAAPPDVVFDTITDHGSYPGFTPIRKAVIERPGEEAPNGTGAIRALHVVGPPIRELVTAYEPPRLFSYEVLSGVPVRSQAGTVTIEPAGGGSLLRYALEIEPMLPYTGSIVGLLTRIAISRLIDGVAREAASRAAAPAPAPSAA